MVNRRGLHLSSSSSSSSSSSASFPLLPVVLVTVAMVTMVPERVEGQFNVSQVISFLNMTQQEKVTALTQFLASQDEMTKKLLRLAQTLQQLGLQNAGSAGSSGASSMGNSAIPQVLDALPDLLNNSVVRVAARLALDELSRATPSDPVAKEALFNMTVEKTAAFHVPVFSAPFNDTMKKLATQYTLQHFNLLRAVNRFLAQFSARDVLYESSTQGATVNPQCYSDTMDFLDAAVGTTVAGGAGGGGGSGGSGGGTASGVESLSPEHHGWALKMLDSYGKIAGGVMKGALNYVGSFEECISVHAYLPKNSSVLLGRRPHDYVTEFDGRFCRVTFDLPDAVIDSFGVDTHGITLRLHWGMCFPDSCHNEDVAAMFRLGTLEQLNIGVHTVYCVEDDDIGGDSSAIVAIVILILLGGAVVVSTVLEALIQFHNNNFATPGTLVGAGSIEDGGTGALSKKPPPTAAYDNLAYQSTEGKGQAAAEGAPSCSPSHSVPEKAAQGGGLGLPCNYVHHREAGTPDIKQGLPADSHPETTAPNGQERPKRRSPPPSYSPKAENEVSGHGARVPQLVKAFSVLTNMPKILSGKKSPSAIHCLHGVRFFSMLWIILGHTYNYGVLSVVDNPTTMNLVDANTIFRRFTFQAVMAGGFTVDTFFLLSGLLVTYLTLKDMAKSKKTIGYWIMFYVHRFWRLTPMYMVVLMVFACLHTYLGGGPLWPEVLDTAANCKNYWWTNLLYVNNLVHVDNMCMGWTWYLANDMQFYWISPILLIPLFYLAPLGLALVLMVMGLGISLSFYFEHKNGGDLVSMHEDNGYWKEVYITPWCRVAAYTVGILLGYVLYKVKKTTLRMSTAVMGWLLTWGVGLFLVYITYTKNREGARDWNVWEYSAYEAFGRPAWALCVAWIIFACHNNRGGFINSILSWEGFLPVSRLTYAAYLIHPVIMMLHVFSKRALIYIDDYSMAYLYMGHALASYLAAFVFSLVAEAPALALEKLAFRMR